MKVLVTGATGFLGSWITRALLARGHRVRVLVRAHGAPPRPDGLAGLEVEKVEGDVLDRAALSAATRGVGGVVHAAGLISTRPRDRRRLYEVNVGGTRNVLEVAGERGVRVVHTSSVATVGFTADPQSRDESFRAEAADLLDYAYADSKRMAEELALELADGGVQVVTLLPGLLLGPGDSESGSTRVVLQHLRRLLRFAPTGGISFGDVRDVAGAYVAALAKGKPGRRYILAGANRGYGELGHMLAAMTGIDAPWPLPTPLAQVWGLWSEAAAAIAPHPMEELTLVTATYAARFNFCDATRAERELGYRPRAFEATLRDTVVDLLRRGLAPASTDKLRALIGN
jgi:dihydroflavonol-4-reductase